MNCSSCGSPNQAGRKFCGQCGQPLAVTCAACGSANAPTERFCGECGSALSAATPVVGGVTAPTASRPAESQPVAERRHVSVLFADLVGFTALGERRDPEAVRELLTRYFDTAREIVERYGGVVEKFIGDAVMAVWGTPVAHEDDAERSVRAGLELVEAVRGLGAEVGLSDLELRAGVLSGEAAVTLGATNQGMVAGDPVNTASRLQAAAEPGTVLVGESTYQAASGAIVFEPAGEHDLKGKALPVPAWRAIRVVAKRGGAGRSENLEPPFVGREEELRLLKDLFHTTSREGRPRLVSLIGQAGLGKSRLAWEYYKYVDGVLELVYWHQGRSPAYGEGITFWALGEMVRRRAGVAETDDEPTTRARVGETLAEFVPDDVERRWIEPKLLHLLGVEDTRTADRDELFAAWRTFFERVAARAPVVMLFEDLHWADVGLLDFIEHLLEWARNSPIYIVTLARPELLEKRPSWGAGQRSFISLPLERLTDAQMRELLMGFVPGLPGTTVQSILERAEGVPLYAVEIVRMLLQQGRLAMAEGKYQLIGDVSHLEVPETLQSLIAARLDSLDAEDRALVQAAAVLGQSFTVAALAAVSGVPADDLEAPLRDLVRRDLLSIDRDPRSPERGQYVFVQSLIREVAYGTLANRDRRSRHLAAARYFESLGDEELAGALATHYVDAYTAAPDGDEGRALAAQARIALRAAAERASALHSYGQALAYLRQARDVTTEPADLAELLERSGTAAWLAGLYAEAEPTLEESISLYRSVGDGSGAARAAARLGLSQMFRGQTNLATSTMEAAVGQLETTDSDPAVVTLHAALARGYLLAGQVERALEMSERTLVAAERLDLVPDIADLLTTRASILQSRGRLREAVVVFRGVQDLARAHDLAVVDLRATSNLSFLQVSTDPRAGLETARAGLEKARRIGQKTWVNLIAGNGTYCALRVGEWDWALELLDELLAAGADDFTFGDLMSTRLIILGLRGDTGDEGKAELVSRTAHLQDPQVDDQIVLHDAWRAFASAEYLAAYRMLMDAPMDAPEIAYSAALRLPLAARCAAWSGDVHGVRTALSTLEVRGVHGDAIEASRQTMEASAAALEGRPAEALAAFRDAIRRWQELGLPFEMALCMTDLVVLMGRDRPETAAAETEAREILGSLGATTVLARLDSAPSSASAAAPPPERQAAPTPS